MKLINFNNFDHLVIFYRVKYSMLHFDLTLVIVFVLTQKFIYILKKSIILISLQTLPEPFNLTMVSG